MQILRYKLRFKHFLKSYSQIFPEIMGFPYVRMSRHIRPNVRTCQWWLHDVTMLMQRWTRALFLPIPMCTPYMQLYFPTIRKDFHRNAQNSMCMQYFSADELTTGVKKHTIIAQFFSKLRTCLFFLLLSLGVGAMSNEQLRHPFVTVFCKPHHGNTFKSPLFIKSVLVVFNQ